MWRGCPGWVAHREAAPCGGLRSQTQVVPLKPLTAASLVPQPRSPHPPNPTPRAGPSCSFTCASKCAVCTGVTRLADGNKTVTIDVDGCKRAPLSWMCCKGAANDLGAALACTLAAGACTASEGAPNYELGKQKWV